MRAPLFVLLLAAVAAGGCLRVGRGVEAFPVANSPAGVTTTVSLRSGIPVTGELLEVRDTALVIRRGNELVLAPNASIAQVTFQGPDLETQSITPNQFVSRNLRLFSRYPSGISSTVMTALLSASGMTEPTVVR